jgi:hypothetical protein
MPAKQSTFRHAAGSVLIGLVWLLYLVRILFGTGPMRDHHGNPAPVVHYLAGAVVVTGMVAAWILGMYWANKRRASARTQSRG